jgi:hypothetical protein
MILFWPIIMLNLIPSHNLKFSSSMIWLLPIVAAEVSTAENRLSMGSNPTSLPKPAPGSLTVNFSRQWDISILEDRAFWVG